MFLKETRKSCNGGFWEKKNFGYKGKILIKENILKKVFNGYPCKKITKYFICIFFCLRAFFYFLIKKLALFSSGGRPPPPSGRVSLKCKVPES